MGIQTLCVAYRYYIHLPIRSGPYAYGLKYSFGPEQQHTACIVKVGSDSRRAVRGKRTSCGRQICAHRIRVTCNTVFFFFFFFLMSCVLSLFNDIYIVFTECFRHWATVLRKVHTGLGHTASRGRTADNPNMKNVHVLFRLGISNNIHYHRYSTYWSFNVLSWGRRFA